VLRWSLVILSVWPFLLPPGFCLCRLGSLGPRASGVIAAEPEPAGDPHPPRRCCRHKSAPAGGTQHKGRAADARPCEPAPEAPHSPACPAHPSWVAVREGALVKAAPVCDSFLACLCSAAPERAAAPAAPERGPAPCDHPSAPVPVYLSCRGLLC
jgi:hypothetical protein